MMGRMGRMGGVWSLGWAGLMFIILDTGGRGTDMVEQYLSARLSASSYFTVNPIRYPPSPSTRPFDH